MQTFSLMVKFLIFIYVYLKDFTLNNTTMKKIFLLIIVLGISLTTYAQDGGGLDNQFYFRFGFSKPANSYFGAEKSDWDDVSRTGGVFELGSIFIFNNLDLADGLRLGINVDYLDISYHQFDYDIEDVSVRVIKLSSKVGPSLSYNPVSKLVLDAYIKAKIPWVGGLWLDFPDVGFEDDEQFIGTGGFGFSTGFNIRFSVLMLGFEYTCDRMKLKNVDDSDYYFGNVLDVNDTGDKSKLANFNFTVGVSF
jgi:hypothetical protein